MMRRLVVVLGMVAAVAVGLFAARGAGQVANPEPRRGETAATDVETRLSRLQERTQKIEEQLARLKAANDRLADDFDKARATAANLQQQLKPIIDFQLRLARSIVIEPSGTVRISGNLRLENNVLDDTQTIGCDDGELSSGRQCTCPDGYVTTGIELRPLATSAFPGPATYNTGLVCSRL